MVPAFDNPAAIHYNYNIRINNPSVLDQIEFDVNVDDYIIDSI